MANFSTNNTLLIKALKKGNPEAYTSLVDQYHHKLCSYAFSLTHDHNSAEDIVQNVFVKLWQKRLDFKDNFNIKSYLYKSTYNQFIDEYRKEKATTALEKKYIEALDTVVDDDDSSIDQLIKLVKEEIQNLPPKCKQTFILSRQEGLTNVEIAEYQNVSIKTVEAQITKAFSLIRKNIGSKTNGILFLLFGRQTITS